MNTSNKLKLASFLIGATGATAASSDGKYGAGKYGGEKKVKKEDATKTAKKAADGKCG